MRSTSGFRVLVQLRFEPSAKPDDYPSARVGVESEIFYDGELCEPETKYETSDRILHGHKGEPKTDCPAPLEEQCFLTTEKSSRREIRATARIIVTKNPSCTQFLFWSEVRTEGARSRRTVRAPSGVDE